MIKPNIFIEKQMTEKTNKEISFGEVINIVETLEKKSGWKIKEIIRNLQKGLFDGCSISRNSPYVHLYIGRGLNNINLHFSTIKDEMRVEIPIDMVI
jgi:hypothetical protein